MDGSESVTFNLSVITRWITTYWLFSLVLPFSFSI